MSESRFERRLQLLLDHERYDRVASEAERSGRSVAAIIRDAIDLKFPDDGDAGRQAAARRLLDRRSGSSSATPGEGPAELKELYAAELESKVTV